MPQNSTDPGHRRALAEHARGGGVPQHMSTVDGRVDPGPGQRTPDDLGDRRTGQWAKWSQNRCKDCGHLQGWPASLQIKQDLVADLLRQWQ